MTQIDDLLAKARAHWTAGRPARALHVLATARKRQRGVFALDYAYAQYLGDSVAGRSTAEARKTRRAAIQILRRLCRSLRGRTPDERWKVRRHYYHFSGQHRKNVALGREEIRKGNARGQLSIGFGALALAAELLAKGDRRRAALWAAQSSEAFEAMLRLDPPQANRLFSLSAALVIQGRDAEAEAAAAQAAGLSPAPTAARKQHEARLAPLRRQLKRSTSGPSPSAALRR